MQQMVTWSSYALSTYYYIMLYRTSILRYKDQVSISLCAYDCLIIHKVTY